MIIQWHKQVKGNPYNHLKTHTPLTAGTSCSFKMTFKRPPCSTKWIDVNYKPLGCIILTMLIHFFTTHAIKRLILKNTRKCFPTCNGALKQTHKVQNAALQ